MGASEEQPRDRWADWLLRGRDAHLTDAERSKQAEQLDALRDRVLSGARITSGDKVLDIGAGTGLLTIRAAALAAQVVAADISHDALRHCREQAGAAEASLPVHCVVGDAVQLPVPTDSFDVVVARSVLIYVWEKRRAIDEIFRVLRPGGRVSVFEPINSAAQRLGLDDPDVPDEIRSDHEHVRATFERRSEHREPMMGFDERDLISWFIGAGFDAVGLSYELLYTRLAQDPGRVAQFLDFRGNPTAPTWREAAVEALGSRAEPYLRALVEAQGRQTRTSIFAHAFVTATRPAVQ